MATQSTADVQDVYDRLAAEHLGTNGVTMGRALSNDVLKINNKIFAFVMGERLVVKLPSARCTSLLADGEAHPFSSGGRTMKEWVAVDLPPGKAGEKTWRALMAAARAYVGG